MTPIGSNHEAINSDHGVDRSRPTKSSLRLPEIDRGDCGSRGRRPRRGKKILVAMAASTILVLSLSVLLAPSADEHSGLSPAKITYTSHSPITINGNAQFNNTLYPSNGVVSGNGTASNPYIIEGWDLSSASGTAVRIMNTDAHFVFRNCFVHGSGMWWGIYQLHGSNGTFCNNTFSSNSIGIIVDQSSNNTLSGNNFSANDRGIYLIKACTDNTISNNTFSGNGSGIDLQMSERNILRDNNCSSNINVGIYIFTESNGNTVINNTCGSSDTFGTGIIIQGARNNLLLNNNCSNNPFIGIYLMQSSTGNKLYTNTFNSNGNEGIILQESSSNDIVDNDCSNNGFFGVHLLQSSNYNNISWNRFADNAGQAIYIESGSHNRIWYNNFTNNNGGGIQAYDAGTNNWWNSSGSPHGYGNWWSDLTTPDSNSDGIVDWSYNLTGSAGAKDNYPLTTPPVPIPEFGIAFTVMMTLMATIVLTIAARKRSTSPK